VNSHFNQRAAIIMTRDFHWLVLSLTLAPMCVVQAADDQPADAAAAVSADAKAVGAAFKHGAKVVAAAAKEDAQHVSVAAKEAAHQVAVTAKEGARQVAAAAKHGAEKTKAAVKGVKTDKQTSPGTPDNKPARQ
jgi:hypothetical protein